MRATNSSLLSGFDTESVWFVSISSASAAGFGKVQTRLPLHYNLTPSARCRKQSPGIESRYAVSAFALLRKEIGFMWNLRQGFLRLPWELKFLVCMGVVAFVCLVLIAVRWNCWRLALGLCDLLGHETDQAIAPSKAWVRRNRDVRDDLETSQRNPVGGNPLTEGAKEGRLREGGTKH